MVFSLPAETGQATIDRLTGALNDVVLADSGEALYRTEALPESSASIGVTLRLDRVTEEDLQRLTVDGLPLSAFVSLQEPHSGAHDAMGIFALYMQGMPSNQEPIHQLDVLPTILTLLKLRPASDLKGRSLLENPLEPIPSYDHLRVSAPTIGGAEVNTDFLKQLGYIE